MLAFFIMTGNALCQTTRPAVIVTSGAKILIDLHEDAPIHRAVQDFIRDFDKVFGNKLEVINSVSGVNENATIIVITCKGETTRQFRSPNITDFESHLITTRLIDGHNAVVLQGADMRGTIYAIYTFLEKFLEIPPLWFWASHEPDTKKHIEIPEGTYLYFPSPYVKWRAWFPNDRDLLAPWQNRSDENYDAFYETMLRLKLNTFELALTLSGDPGVKYDLNEFKPYKAGRDVCHARDRGLKISFTHTSPFGSNFASWDLYWKKIRNQAPPQLSVKDVNSLKDFWGYHIEMIQKEKLDVIWQLGFRSSGDKAFWKTFADSPKSNIERAKVIESMLKVQIDLLKQLTGEKHPLMKITFYDEVSDLMAAGLLNLPNEPTLIWNFVAARRDHYPATDIQRVNLSDDQLFGYYMNFQFTSSGSHLAAAEGPWKMERNFRYIDGKSTQPLTFSVVNAGNIREHVRELSANAAMMWDFNSYDSNMFMENYSRTYFGDEFAEDIAALYKDYYYSYWLPKKTDLHGFDRQYIFQDQRYSRAIFDFCRKWGRKYSTNPLEYEGIDTGGRYYRIVPEDNNACNQLDAIINGTEQSMEAFRNAIRKADGIYQELSPREKLFFNDDLRTQAIFMFELNKALNSIVRAYRAKGAGNPDKSEKYLEETLRAIAKLRKIKTETEHGKFKDWYKTDRIFGMKSLWDKASAIKQ